MIVWKTFQVFLWFCGICHSDRRENLFPPSFAPSSIDDRWLQSHVSTAKNRARHWRIFQHFYTWPLRSIDFRQSPEVDLCGTYDDMVVELAYTTLSVTESLAMLYHSQRRHSLQIDSSLNTFEALLPNQVEEHSSLERADISLWAPNSPDIQAQSSERGRLGVFTRFSFLSIHFHLITARCLQRWRLAR